jgi:hypothetical protein
MALKYRVGLISGSRQQFQLPMTVFSTTRTALNYEDAILFAEQNAPGVLAGNKKTDDISITEKAASAITFLFTYKQPAQDELRRRASSSTKPKKLFSFLAPIGVYKLNASGLVTEDVSAENESIKWKPDRTSTASEFKGAKGVMVDPLAESRTLDFFTNASVVTNAYLDTIEDMVVRGVFNQSPIFTKPAFTLQIVRFSATERDDDDWELSFGFGYQPVREDVEVGDGIKIPKLRGCDYWYPIEKDIFADDVIQPKVDRVVLGQVWEADDFITKLNLPSIT